MKHNYYYPVIPNFSDFDRLFNIAAPTLGSFSRLFNEHSVVSAPAADFFEDDSHYYVQAELPGIKKEGVSVELEDGVLTIAAQQAEAGEQSEHKFTYRRSVTVPDGVDAENIRASQADGILTVTLPKAPQAKAKQITVN